MEESKEIKEVTVFEAHELDMLSSIFSFEESSNEAKEFQKLVPVKGLNVLMQPTSLTYSVYRTTDFQENVLTEIVRCLQPYMTKTPGNVLSINNVLCLSISLDMSKFSSDYKSLSRVEKLLVDLEKIRFKFEWKMPTYKKPDGTIVPEKRFERSGVLFTTHDREKGTYNYKLYINTLALPYLTYIGKGMYYTEFNYAICQKLRSSYCKRFYKLICDWSYSNPISLMKTYKEIKELLGLPESYSNSLIKTRIFDRVAQELSDSDAKVKFTYAEYSSVDTVNKTKPNIDSVIFYFQTSQKPGKPAIVSRETRVKSLIDCLKTVADKEKYGDLIMAANQFVDSDLDGQLFSKFKYYNHKLMKQLITTDQFKNIILKIVRESPYNCDLRSSLHIRNSSKLDIKFKKKNS